MLSYVTGNLLEADVEALVNTVNTVGVMGKGVALMFKEAFPENYRAYRTACERGAVVVGQMFLTERESVLGPRWIVNFPTKQHWRGKTRIEWIREGLVDLRRNIDERGIRSIALPPLGCGQGGLDWKGVRPLIESALGPLEAVDVRVYEPTRQYQNVAKPNGVQKLTPARAMIAELVRRYWILGIECTMLEVQKLAWFLERSICALGLENPLDLRFKADRYGPYADRLRHLLDGLDGSYLRSEVRIPDAGVTDVLAFDDARKDHVATYLATEARAFLPALDRVSAIIDGFESPLGMELLATVDWLISEGRCLPQVGALEQALASWPGGGSAGRRKLDIFSDRLLALALERLLDRQFTDSVGDSQQG